MKKVLVILGIVSLAFLASCGEKVKETVENTADTVKEKATDVKEGAVEMAEDVKEGVEDTAEAVGEKVEEVAEVVTGETGKYDGENISFEYPTDWEMSEMQGLIQVLSPLAEGDDFAENVNFITQDLAGLGVSYDEFFEMNMETVKQMLDQNGGKIVSEEDTEVAGNTAKKMVYEFGMADPMDATNTVTIRTTQYFISSGDGAYIVTFTNNADAPDEFKDEFAAVLESITIK